MTTLGSRSDVLGNHCDYLGSSSNYISCTTRVVTGYNHLNIPNLAIVTTFFVSVFEDRVPVDSFHLVAPAMVTKRYPLLINPFRANFFRGNLNMYFHLMSLTWHRYLKSFLMYDKGLPILHSQYHGCWCPGDVGRQGISNHDIYYVESEWFGPRTLKVNYRRCHDIKTTFRVTLGMDKLFQSISGLLRHHHKHVMLAAVVSSCSPMPRTWCTSPERKTGWLIIDLWKHTEDTRSQTLIN